MTRRSAVRLVCAAAVVVLVLAHATIHSRATVAGTTSANGPHRIVSLVPAATEMLFAIGADARVVGVGSHDRFPAEVGRLPRVGGLLDPNVERILALRPDLVVAYTTQTALREQLDRAGIPVFTYIHRDLRDVTRTLRALGARVGLQARAEAEADRIEQALAAVARRVGGRARPSTLVVIGHEAGTMRQVLASGGYGFLHDLVELAGGRDVVGDIVRESVVMSTELILTRSPEVILDLHYGEPLSQADVDAERRVWEAAAVPAVKTGRVHVLVGDEFVVPGPRIVAAAEKLAAALASSSASRR